MFGLKKYRDPDIISEVKKGNERMLVVIFEKNYLTTKNYIEQHLPAAKPEEILKDVVVDAWEEIQNPEFDAPNGLEEFVLLKLESRVEKLNASKTKAEVEAEREEQIKLSEIQKYMKFLPDVCRNVLYYTYFEKWELEKIAEKLEYPNLKEITEKKNSCKRKYSQLIKRNLSFRNLV